MDIRLAFPNEVDKILALQGEKARALNHETVFEAVLTGTAWVGLVDDMLVAYATVVDGHQSAYDQIEGQWQHDNYRYLTLTDVIIPADQPELAKTFLQGLIEGHDTPDCRCEIEKGDDAMSSLLEEMGYLYCGKRLDKPERLLYQKIKRKQERGFYQEINESNPL